MNKKLSVILMSCAFGAFSIIGCNSKTTSETEVPAEGTVELKDKKPVGGAVSGNVSPSIFGEEISVEEVTSAEDLLAGLESTDTLRDIVIGGKIASVCKKKGCWMNVQMGEEKEVFVKFKDYGFFMPLDASGKEVIVAGKAFVTEVSVADLKHYAEDAGKSSEEIANITAPAKEFAFEANGVLLKK